MSLVGFSSPYYSPAPPFYTGTVPLGTDAPPGAVAIGDRWYLLDMASDRFREASVPALRPQADTSERPGEPSLSVEGLWRRTVATWVGGAGQAFYDRLGSTPLRFDLSRGVDPWTEWELSLLPEIHQVDEVVTEWTSLALGTFEGVRHVVAGSADGEVEVYATDGTPAASITLAGNIRLASAGTGTYVAHDGGISIINDDLSGATSFNANVLAADVLRFVKGRLMAAVGNVIWDVIDGTTSTSLFTNGWPDYTWTDFAEGPGGIYATGYSGDRGSVWLIPIKDDASGLDAPRVAVDLPDGEVPLSCLGYVGYVVVGTSKGVRIGSPSGEGLTLGPLIGDGPVRCLEGQDRFVWFGWDDTFSDAAGLGRMDLSRFITPLGPAYATDSVGNQPGRTTAVITVPESTLDSGCEGDRRWFAVGDRLFRECPDSTLTTGWFTTGWITFGLSDPKVAVNVDVRHAPLLAGEDVTVAFATERGGDDPEYRIIGSSYVDGAIAPQRSFPVSNDRSIAQQIKVTLNNPDQTMDGPRLFSVSLSAQPSPQRSSVLFLPVLLHDIVTREGAEYLYDVQTEVSRFREYVRYQRLLRIVMGSSTFLGFVEDYEWVPYSSDDHSSHWNGTMVIKVKSAEVGF